MPYKLSQSFLPAFGLAAVITALYIGLRNWLKYGWVI